MVRPWNVQTTFRFDPERRLEVRDQSLPLWFYRSRVGNDADICVYVIVLSISTTTPGASKRRNQLIYKVQ